MRLFIAVPITKELKKRVAEVQEKIRKANSDIKFVEAENLHFTLKFLGETPESKLESIRKAIEIACEKFRPFDILIAGISAFPSKNYMRVIWLSVKEGYEEFERLIKTVDEELSREGFAKDKEHIPHLTVARVRSCRNKPELLKVLQNLEQTEIGKMYVSEVKLVKSTLRRAGPVYEEVYKMNLK